MNNKRLYMDVHVIQVLPPSNINRDDTGSPKTAQYGGVRRARVSSQAWKKAMRDYFRENSLELGLGVRSKNVVDYVAKRVNKLNPEIELKDAREIAKNTLKIATKKKKDDKGISFKGDKKKGEKKDNTLENEDYILETLFFMGDKQAETLAQAIADGKYTKDTKFSKDTKEDLLKILNGNSEIDIILFGRMVADEPKLNTDAACQVAHAISTHAVQTEFDYFTAMDDLSPEEQSGAAHLDSVEYNSSTLYRYANISIHEFFVSLLKDEASTTAACKLFIEAFSNSMPTGKINTFANQTLPSLVMVTLREDRPVNLVSAFEQPVQIRAGSGYVNKSIEKLMEEYEKTGKFVDAPLGNFYLNVTEQPIDGAGEACDNLKDLLQKVGQKIEDCLKEAGDLN